MMVAALDALGNVGNGLDTQIIGRTKNFWNIAKSGRLHLR